MGKDRYILTKNKKNLLSICVLPSLLKGFLSCMIKKNGRLFGIPAKLT